jgi:hypothetical protein
MLTSEVSLILPAQSVTAVTQLSSTFPQRADAKFLRSLDFDIAVSGGSDGIDKPWFPLDNRRFSFLQWKALP